MHRLPPHVVQSVKKEGAALIGKNRGLGSVYWLLGKEDACAVALRDLLLFFAFNLTWPGRVEVGWHETSQSN